MSKEVSRRIIESALSELGILEDNFDITPKLVKILCHKYVNRDSKTQFIKPKHKRLKAYSRHYNFILLDLLAIKYKRCGSAKNIAEGFVYAVRDPAHPKFIKIGSSIDVRRRVKQYHTYSPDRNAYLVESVFSYNRLLLEKDVLAKFPVKKGEWVEASEDKVRALFLCLKKNTIMPV